MKNEPEEIEDDEEEDETDGEPITPDGTEDNVNPTHSSSKYPDDMEAGE